MEREAKNREECRSPEPDFLVHWGRNKKRQRTIKAKDDINSDPKKQIVRMARSNEESSISRLSKSNFLQQQQQQTKPSCIQRKTHLQEHGEIQKERGYSTRSSGFPANNNLTTEAHELHLPKFSISLNVKEMDEDFMTIAGLKLHRRPKKRLKFIQRMIDFISPAACLPDSITVESYEVQEEKSYKKKPRGLKAMVLANTESDSE